MAFQLVHKARNEITNRCLLGRLQVVIEPYTSINTAVIRFEVLSHCSKVSVTLKQKSLFWSRSTSAGTWCSGHHGQRPAAWSRWRNYIPVLFRKEEPERPHFERRVLPDGQRIQELDENRFRRGRLPVVRATLSVLVAEALIIVRLWSPQFEMS